MPLSTYQKKAKVTSKNPKKNMIRIVIWALALVLTTAGLSAGYTVLSQAFGAEDKASAVELCRFGAKDVTGFEQMRTVTTGSGSHVFIQSKVKYANGNTAGLIAFKENVIEDPCQGITNITTIFDGKSETDISVQNWYLAEWDMTNAVFVPDLYTDASEDGYIVLFLREDTKSYTKELATSLLRYSKGKLSFVKTTTAFGNNENFSSIVNALYSYDANTLYVLGTTESEGVRGRGMHLASISHEDTLLSNENYFYCNTSTAIKTLKECEWESDVKKSKTVIATKTGGMDVVGLNDNISLLLQNTGKEVKVYDLAETGTVWNPGLTLLNCLGTDSCNQISTYDYQMTMYENAEENVKVMTFDFIQPYNGQAILYEATINDFAVANSTALINFPQFNLQSAAAKIVEEDSRNEKVTIRTKAKPVAGTAIYAKERPYAPKVENTKSKLKLEKVEGRASVHVIEAPVQQSVVAKVIRALGGGSKPVVTITKNKGADDVPKHSVAPTPIKGDKKKVEVKRIDDIVVANSANGSGTHIGMSGGGRATIRVNETLGTRAFVKANPSPLNGIEATRLGTQTTKLGIAATNAKAAKEKADCTPPNKWVCDYGDRDCSCDKPYVPPLKTKAERFECAYGKLNSSNNKDCTNSFQKCDAYEKITENCTTEASGGLKYAALTKCIGAKNNKNDLYGQIKSCCPTNTHREGTKCVEYADMEAKNPENQTVTLERCKYGPILNIEKKLCEAALPKCDGSNKVDVNGHLLGDGLDCSSVPIKRSMYQKCRGGDIIYSCCKKGSVAKDGYCKQGKWVFPEKCYDDKGIWNSTCVKTEVGIFVPG